MQLLPYIIENMEWKTNSWKPKSRESRPLFYDKFAKNKVYEKKIKENIQEEELVEVLPSQPEISTFDMPYLKFGMKVEVIEKFTNIPIKAHNKLLKTIISQLVQIKGIY